MGGFNDVSVENEGFIGFAVRGSLSRSAEANGGEGNGNEKRQNCEHEHNGLRPIGEHNLLLGMIIPEDDTDDENGECTNENKHNVYSLSFFNNFSEVDEFHRANEEFGRFTQGIGPEDSQQDFMRV